MVTWEPTILETSIWTILIVHDSQTMCLQSLHSSCRVVPSTVGQNLDLRIWVTTKSYCQGSSPKMLHMLSWVLRNLKISRFKNPALNHDFPWPTRHQLGHLSIFWTNWSTFLGCPGPLVRLKRQVTFMPSTRTSLLHPGWSGSSYAPPIVGASARELGRWCPIVG